MRIWVHGFGNGSGTGTPPPAGFTPADIVGIQEWWNTGAGLVETSNQVQSWTGQINSTVLTKNTGTGMTYTAADVEANNKPTIYQTAARNLATLQNNNITSFTPTVERFIGFIGIAKDTGNAAYRIMGGQTSTGGSASEAALLVSSPTGANLSGAYFFTGGVKTAAATANDELFYMIVQIDSGGTTGTIYYNTTSGTAVSGINLNTISPFNIEVGGYENSSATNWEGKVMETFVGTGTISASDLTDLDTYVSSTY